MSRRSCLIVATFWAFFALALPALTRPGSAPGADATGLAKTGADATGSAQGTKSGEALDKAQFFATQVKPILQANCFRCHGGETKIKAGLNLTTREGLLKGGDSGSAVDLQAPEKSRLLLAVRGQDPDITAMPPGTKLIQAQIDILAKWVQMGAPYSADKVVRHGAPKVDAEAKKFWAWQPLSKPAIPAVKNKDWVKNPIDAFILAKLEAVGMKPAPPADHVTLLRRLYYDLSGLPPTPEEVREFLKEASAKPQEAYEAVVDRLLASPHYGEKWARHWLDLVRYAESNSFERDSAKPFVWRYRDYVIGSFNEDKPYPQFIREQIAGDELEPVTADGIIATGYYRLGLWDDEPADPVLAKYDELDDIVSTTGQAFLGLTLGCARCHDHKIDPVPQKDYYRFLAFFHGIRRYGVRSNESVAAASLRPIALPVPSEEQKRALAEHQQKIAELRQKIAAIEAELKPKLQGGEKDDFEFPENRPGLIKKHSGGLLRADTYQRYQGLLKQKEGLEKKAPTALAQALCVTEIGPTPPDTFVLIRGNPNAKGEKVEPGFPSVLTSAPGADATGLAKLPPLKPGAQTSGRRRVVAEWLASKDNALVWRVAANRLWQHHFGRGIVRSSSNFGYQGSPPTHPELLDWLAMELRDNGGRFKPLHRLMVLSNTYRMSARPDPAALKKDPENDHFWRFNPRRLTAEEIRDTILAVSGNLNKKMYGPSIFPKIAKEVLAGQSQPGLGWKVSSPEEAARRSIYVHSKRSLPLPILAVFDQADLDAPCPVRFTTTQPAQALALVNGEWINEQAGIFAASLKKEAGADRGAQVRLALWRVTQRAPTAKEIERGLEFMTLLERQERITQDESLRLFCLLALNLNEMMYLD